MPAIVHKIPSKAHHWSPRIPWVPKYNAEEQTKLSWAKIVESYAVVPKTYKDFFEPLITAGIEFPHTVLTPTREGFMQWTTEKLVCDLGSEICVLEGKGNTFEAQRYPIKGISYVEAGMALLKSSIKITGVTDKGVPASSVFQFNSVTDFLFTPILKRIRNSNGDPKWNTQKSEMEDFDHWARSNFKFMNYARRSVLTGDRVVHSILQPEILKDKVTILGKTYYKTISPTHACILTNRELIMIREEVNRRGDDRYGGVWDYIPLNKIANLSLREMNGDLFSLLIELPEDEQIEFLYQSTAKEEVNMLLHRFRELTT